MTYRAEVGSTLGTLKINIVGEKENVKKKLVIRKRITTIVLTDNT